MAKLTRLFIAFMLFTFLGCSAMAEQPVFFSANMTTLDGPTDDNLMSLLHRYDTIVIKFGGGGKVYGMFDTLDYLKTRPHKTIIIDGGCYSACTMLLTSPNVLLTQNARIFFHSATSTVCEDGKNVTRLGHKANKDMLGKFNPMQRAWIKLHKAYASTNFTEMPKKLVRQLYKSKFIDGFGSGEKIMSVKVVPGAPYDACKS